MIDTGVLDEWIELFAVAYREGVEYAAEAYGLRAVVPLAPVLLYEPDVATNDLEGA